MSESVSPKPPPDDSDESRLKIYFLPNLLTAGNLFCGFVALTKIVEADPWATILSARSSSRSPSFARVHFRFVRRARGALGRRGKPVRARIRFAGGLDFVRRRPGVSGASHRAARRVCANIRNSAGSSPRFI
jgi:hypothetical protein